MKVIAKAGQGRYLIEVTSEEFNILKAEHPYKDIDKMEWVGEEIKIERVIKAFEEIKTFKQTNHYRYLLGYVKSLKESIDYLQGKLEVLHKMFAEDILIDNNKKE